MQLKSSVLSAAVKSALVAAGLAAGVASAMTPGAYEATAQGRNADVTVRVTVSADKIEKIEIVKHSETPGIGDLAVNELPAAMLSAQTAAVDAVGGATMSSEAIKKAVAETLRKAGASDKFLTAPKAGADKAAAADFKTSADVIVVGAGGAGMVAAATVDLPSSGKRRSGGSVYGYEQRHERRFDQCADGFGVGRSYGRDVR